MSRAFIEKMDSALFLCSPSFSIRLGAFLLYLKKNGLGARLRAKEERLIELVKLLTAVKLFCKDAHYSFYGVNFKPLHEWVDDIAEPIDGFIDEIFENYVVFMGKKVPRSVEINAGASDYVPTALGENDRILASLQAILTMAHNKLNEIDVKEAGINDLLGRIDTHLMKQIALINMAIVNQKRED